MATSTAGLLSEKFSFGKRKEINIYRLKSSFVSCREYTFTTLVTTVFNFKPFLFLNIGLIFALELGTSLTILWRCPYTTAAIIDLVLRRLAHQAVGENTYNFIFNLQET